MDNFLNWVVSWINVYGLDPQIAKDIVIIALCFAMAVICLFLALLVFISPLQLAKKNEPRYSITTKIEKHRNNKRNGNN